MNGAFFPSAREYFAALFDQAQAYAVAAGGNSLFGYKSGGALIVFALLRD